MTDLNKTPKKSVSIKFNRKREISKIRKYRKVNKMITQLKL